MLAAQLFRKGNTPVAAAPFGRGPADTFRLKAKRPSWAGWGRRRTKTNAKLFTANYRGFMGFVKTSRGKPRTPRRFPVRLRSPAHLGDSLSGVRDAVFPRTG